MQRVFSAFFTPEVLGWVLLTAVGVFVFLLIRPRQQDTTEDFWLAFMQQHLRAANPGQRAGSKPHPLRADGAEQALGDRPAGLPDEFQARHEM